MRFMQGNYDQFEGSKITNPPGVPTPKQKCLLLHNGGFPFRQNPQFSHANQGYTDTLSPTANESKTASLA